MTDHQTPAGRINWLRPPQIPTQPGTLLTESEVAHIDLAESLTLDLRRFKAKQRLLAMGKCIIENGNTFRPCWGRADPEYNGYAVERPLLALVEAVCPT